MRYIALLGLILGGCQNQNATIINLEEQADAHYVAAFVELAEPEYNGYCKADNDPDGSFITGYFEVRWDYNTEPECFGITCFGDKYIQWASAEYDYQNVEIWLTSYDPETYSVCPLLVEE